MPIFLGEGFDASAKVVVGRRRFVVELILDGDESYAVNWHSTLKVLHPKPGFDVLIEREIAEASGFVARDRTVCNELQRIAMNALCATQCNEWWVRVMRPAQNNPLSSAYRGEGGEEKKHRLRLRASNGV